MLLQGLILFGAATGLNDGTSTASLSASGKGSGSVLTTSTSLALVDDALQGLVLRATNVTSGTGNLQSLVPSSDNVNLAPTYNRRGVEAGTEGGAPASTVPHATGRAVSDLGDLVFGDAEGLSIGLSAAAVILLGGSTCPQGLNPSAGP